MASAKALEGDWQYTSEQALDQIPNSFDIVFRQGKRTTDNFRAGIQ